MEEPKTGFWDLRPPQKTLLCNFFYCATMAASGEQRLPRDAQQRRWHAFRDAGNDTCAECEARDTTWAVLDYGER